MTTLDESNGSALTHRSVGVPKLILALRDHWPLLIPGLLVFLLYLPALTYGLVWDDTIFLRDLPDYRDPVLWLVALFRPFVLSPDYFRPLTLLTFVGEFRLGGSPLLFHLTNLLLHSINTLLVSLLAWRLWVPVSSRSKPTFRLMAPALAAGLLYGLHPALIEGVAFISGRFDLLMTTFVLLAFLADYALRGRPSRTTLVGLAFLAAALAKEMAIAFALALPLWHLATGDAKQPPLKRLRANGNLSVYAAVLITGLTYLGIRYFSLGYLLTANPPGSIPVGTPVQHVLLIGKSLAAYAITTLWPFVTLTPIHFSQLPIVTSNPAAWIALVFDALLLFGVVVWIRRAPASGWLALGGVLALLPVVNLIPLQLGVGAFIAERFLMFPIALLALAVSGLLRVPAPQPPPSSPSAWRASWLVGGLWLLAAAVTLQIILPNWRDDLTLWRWAARRAPQSATPYTNLSLQYSSMGQYDLAAQLAQHALTLDEKNGDAWNDLGLALFNQKSYADSQATFEKATTLQPGNALFWNNLAGALREQDKLAEAEKILVDQSLRLSPSLPAAQLNLGLVYLRADRPDLALPHLELAMRLLPPQDAAQAQGSLDSARDPTRWLRLGQMQLTNGDTKGAAAAFAQARAFGASPADVAVGESSALIQLKDWKSAESILQEAVKQAPADARLYNNLGISAREQGQTGSARQYFSRASELAPSWDLPKNNLNALPASP
jgi:tetratricopeptide (TPR) repeat protein